MSIMQKKPSKAFIFNTIIGIAIMILFRFLPISLPHVTDIGLEVLGIFIGTLWLWTTVDPLWASLFSIGMIGLSSYGTMDAVLAQCFGSPVVVQILFLMIIVGALVENKITLYIGRFFMTRKIIEGRPWAFAAVMMIGAFLMSAFVSPFAPIFLFWPVVYDIFAEVGYTKNDKYPKILVVFIVIGTMLGFPVPPFMSNGLALLSNYRNITEGKVYINDGLYMLLTVVTNLVMMAAVILFAKFVLRPDTSKMKVIKVEMLKKNPLPKMNFRQKILVAAFVGLITLLLLPTIINIDVLKVLSENTYGLALIVVAILGAIKLAGEPLMDFPAIMGKQVGWSSYFLCASAILIGNVLTNETTGITPFLNEVLSPLFNNMSPIVFTIFILLVACFFTNLCNSLVIGMILQPIIAGYCAQNNVDAAPIVCIMISFVLLSAMCTPAASPFAAILHGNKEWLKPAETYKYTLMFLAVEIVVVMCVGIPLANILM